MSNSVNDNISIQHQMSNSNNQAVEDFESKIDDGFSNSDNKLLIYPIDYKTRESINASSRTLARRLHDLLTEGDLVLDAIISNKDSEPLIANILLISNRLYVFKVFDIDNVDILLQNTTVFYALISSIEEKISNRLANISVLNNEMSELIVEIRPIVYFSNISSQNFLITELADMPDYFVFKDFLLFDHATSSIMLLFQDLLDVRRMEATYRKAIFLKIVPEYVIVVPEKVNNQSITVEDEDVIIDEYRIYDLDSEQIKIVNDIKPGHYLMLANAGSGKSIILLSKAFKLSQKNPKLRILLTCYNANLADVYKFRKDFAGLDQDNLYIMTFHKFIFDYISQIFSTRFSIEDFDKALTFLEDRIARNDISVKFVGIFIDETQIFESRWINILYSLLETPRDQCFFTLTGDLSQDVRKSKKLRKASWQLAESIPEPKFRGRVKYLNNNYRNSKEISIFLNNYLLKVKSILEGANNEVNSEFSSELLGISENSSSPVTHIKSNRFEECTKVAEYIEKTREEYNIAYNEIAVIFPFKQHKALNYYPHQWLTKILDEKDIPYCEIFSINDVKRTKIYDISGVVVTTVDSCLGLDFKAVIIFGLLPLQFAFTLGPKNKLSKSSLGTINELMDKNSKHLLPHFIDHSNLIYTASSRARKHLVIIDSLEPVSVFSQLLNYSIKEGEK